MVLMGDFLNNVKRLINQYVYTKEETRQNFDNFMENSLCYSNGELCLAENYIYYNSGSDADLYNPQNAIITTNNDILSITTNTSGEKKVSIPYEFEKNDNAFIELTWCGGSIQPIALMFTKGGTNHFGWVSYWIDGTHFDDALDSVSTDVTGTIQIGDVFRLERNNGVSKFYQNGNLLFSYSRTFTENYRFGFYTNNGRVQSWKNIKIGYL